MGFRSFDSWYDQAEASIAAVDHHNKIFSDFLEYVTELKEDLDNANKEIERLQGLNGDLDEAKREIRRLEDEISRLEEEKVVFRRGRREPGEDSSMSSWNEERTQ